MGGNNDKYNKLVADRKKIAERELLHKRIGIIARMLLLIILGFTIVSILVSAMASSVDNISANTTNEQFPVKNIRFEEEKMLFTTRKNVFIETDSETLVYSLSLVEFTKTNDDTFILLSSHPGIVIDHKSVKVHLNNEETKEISKSFAETFKQTLKFEDN